MLPLKSEVNSLQNALRDSDCLVRAPPFFTGRLQHHYARLVLKDPTDRLHMEIPDCGHLGGGVMAFGCGWLLNRIAAWPDTRSNWMSHDTPRRRSASMFKAVKIRHCSVGARVPAPSS